MSLLGVLNLELLHFLRGATVTELPLTYLSIQLIIIMANRLKFQIQFTEEQAPEITQDAKKFEDFYICTKTLGNYCMIVGQGAHAVVK
jgi:hypothetical protein